MSCDRDIRFVSWGLGPSGHVLCVLPHRPDIVLCCTWHATSSMQLYLYSRVPPIHTVAVNRCRPGGVYGGERAVGRFLWPVQSAQGSQDTICCWSSKRVPVKPARDSSGLGRARPGRGLERGLRTGLGSGPEDCGGAPSCMRSRCRATCYPPPRSVPTEPRHVECLPTYCPAWGQA